MSWDAIIAKTSETGKGTPAENAPFLPMGKPDAVRSALNASIPGIEWTRGGGGTVSTREFSLEFMLMGDPMKQAKAIKGSPLWGPQEPAEVGAIGVSARGGGNPIPVLVALAKANHWSITDSQSGEPIDLDAPSSKSWTEFTEWRDSALSGGGPAATQSTAGGINLFIVVFSLAVLTVSLKSLFK